MSWFGWKDVIFISCAFIFAYGVRKVFDKLLGWDKEEVS